MLALVLVVTLLCGTLATNSKTHKHIGTIQKHHAYSKLQRADGKLEHEVIFAVKQNNIEEMKWLLDDISNPESSRYQQWLTNQQVGELTENKASAHEVLRWLAAEQVKVTSVSPYSNYIHATASIAKWESLLDTEFYEWEKRVVPKKHSSPFQQTNELEKVVTIRSEHYSLPNDLVSHISSVFNTCQMLPVIQHHAVPHSDKPLVKTTVFAVQNAEDAKRLKTFENDRYQLRSLSSVSSVTLGYLDEYYYINGYKGNANVQQSVFEINGESFSQSDLTQFQNGYGRVEQAAVDMNGHETSSCTSSLCSEGNLDIQYIMGVSQLTTSIYWYIDCGTGCSDPFLQFLLDLQAAINPPAVNSISWSGPEVGVGVDVLSSFELECAKLGLQGVTIIASSGDDGVAGFGCPCDTSASITVYNCACNANSSQNTTNWAGTNTWTGTGYFPQYPASCPYVTAVGATMGVSNTVPNLNEKEQACQSQIGGVITSGGGFSTYYATPTWQQAQVTAYFNGLTSTNTPSSGYNNQGRGYPDVSFLGVAYDVVIGGSVGQLYGTSASAPMFGGMLSIINALRYNQSKTSVGFINPTLYSSKYAKKFNDVTQGKNKCCVYNGYSFNADQAVCCTAGFVATAGWDPVTGLGSIYLPQLSWMFNESIPYRNANYTTHDDDSLLSKITSTDAIMIAIFGFFGIFFALLCLRHCCLTMRERKMNQNPNFHNVVIVGGGSNNGPHSDLSHMSEQDRIIHLQQMIYNQSSAQRGSNAERVSVLDRNSNAGPRGSTVARRPSQAGRSDGGGNRSRNNSGATGIDWGSEDMWPLWEEETKILSDMGFTNKSAILPLLKKHMHMPESQNPNSTGKPDQHKIQLVIADLINGA